uniref:aminoglycoside phosphotransferase family protein n=1 Tax=Roseovarius indicus TaxID=540747 RepID=UPI003B526052
MSDRTDLIDAFIDRSGWSAAEVSLLAGDASNRRYFRLASDSGNAVLMDAPPEKGEDIRPFVHIAQYLTSLGLSAPKVLAEDDATGLLLLEDLGDALFARVLETEPELENSLYSSATDLLAKLHENDPPAGLDPYDPPLMTDLAALAFDWYAFAATGEKPSDSRQQFHDSFHRLLADNTTESVLIQRDYHAENLLWLPDRSGTARVGLLDFQDAMIGHRAYDLVSLLQDARRDVPEATETAMIARYIEATRQDDDSFRTAYHLLGAQRNLRILGVFARLCVRDNKAWYVDMIPRVWNLLQRDLAHPALASVRPALDTLPAPSPDILQRLKDKCATIPSLS